MAWYLLHGYVPSDVQAGTDAEPLTSSPPQRRRKRQHHHSFRKALCAKLLTPEVIAMTIAWLSMVVLTICMGHMGPVLRAVWKPLAALASIPLAFLIGLCVWDDA